MVHFAECRQEGNEVDSLRTRCEHRLTEAFARRTAAGANGEHQAVREGRVTYEGAADVEVPRMGKALVKRERRSNSRTFERGKLLDADKAAVVGPP